MRSKVTSRKASTRARKQRKRQRKLPILGKTPQQFCADWGWSRSTWNRAQQNGTGPLVLQPSGKRGRMLVTPAAEEEWIRLRTRWRSETVPPHRAEDRPA